MENKYININNVLLIEYSILDTIKTKKSIYSSGKLILLQIKVDIFIQSNILLFYITIYYI